MTAMTTMTLAEFLLARIAEDATVARTCLEAWESLEREHSIVTPAGSEWRIAEITQSVERDHYVYISPSRLLAECDAKRRIVEYARPQSYTSDGYMGPVEYVTDRGQPEVLRLLALPYADHPDYRPEWRP